LGFFTLTIIAGLFIFGSEVWGASSCSLSYDKDTKVLTYSANGLTQSSNYNIQIFKDSNSNAIFINRVPAVNQNISGNYPISSTGNYRLEIIEEIISSSRIICSETVNVILPIVPILPPSTGQADCRSRVSNIWFDSPGTPKTPTVYVLFSDMSGLPNSFTLNAKSASGSVVSSVLVPKPSNLLIQQPVSLSGSGTYSFELSSPFCKELITSGNFNFEAIGDKEKCNPDADACGTGFKCTRTSDCANFANGQCSIGDYYCLADGTPPGTLAPGSFGTTPSSTPLNIPELVGLIIKFSIGAAGVAAFFLLATGSYKFMMSGGDPASIQSAQETISSAIAGLVLIILAVSIFGIMSGILNIPGIDFSGGNLNTPTVTK